MSALAQSNGPACGSCKFGMCPDTKGPLFCHRYPPQVFMIGQGRHPISGLPQFQFDSFWPTLAADQWCGEFVPKLALQN